MIQVLLWLSHWTLLQERNGDPSDVNKTYVDFNIEMKTAGAQSSIHSHVNEIVTFLKN